MHVKVQIRNVLPPADLTTNTGGDNQSCDNNWENNERGSQACLMTVTPLHASLNESVTSDLTQVDKDNTSFP